MTIRRIALAALLVLVGLAGLAAAQPGPPRPGREVRPTIIDPGTQRPPAAAPVPAGAERPGPAATARPAVKERDRHEGSGKGMALLFWAIALGAVGGSIFVITRRNLIAAVMGMVGTFFAVAAVYMLLYAHFLAVIQVLVYAGAIMVLFVFVVMILNRPEDEPWALVGIPGKLLAAVAMLYLTVRLGQVLWSVEPPEAALAAPDPVVMVRDYPKPKPGEPPRPPVEDTFDWGSTGAVGSNLFREYLFPFEAVSILLLAAVVGAIAIARPLGEDEPDDDEGEGPEARS
jgi:NADH-quinone oxidoreductase subunit J